MCTWLLDLDSTNDKQVAELHTISSGVKALCSWYVQKIWMCIIHFNYENIVLALGIQTVLCKCAENVVEVKGMQLTIGLVA